jgi:hypothetical protein
MTRTWVTLTKAFMAVSLGITLAKLATDRGGGQFLLTLIAFVLASTIAPYWISLKTMPRLTPRWATALGISVCVFGVIDVVLRMRGFFFPTDALDGRLAFWLPIYSIAAIPLTAVIAHTFITAIAGERAK